MPPLDLLIKPASGLCNMRCRYCFYADEAKNRTTQSYGIMSEETQKVLVRRALEYAEGSCIFAFQGGEPTLAGLDFFRRQMDFQRRFNLRNVKISNAIQTNGYAIDEEWAKFFAQNHFLVGLSLDGPREVHDLLRRDSAEKGSFDRVMKTVELFRRYGVQFNILTVVNKTVAQNANKVYSFFRSQNFKYLQFIECLDPFEGGQEDYSLTPQDLEIFLKAVFDEYFRDFKNKKPTSVRSFDNYIMMLMGRRPESCGMSGVCTPYCLFEANGDMFPCDFYVLDRYRIGNVHNHTFKELVESPIMKSFAAQSYPVAEKCRGCRWYKLCRGGCKRYREPLSEKEASLNRFCEAYRGFFEYAYPRMVQMAQALQGGR